ncbi:response regulator transcription factor [Labedaea rhizosphaerae]|uniref:DNA-binding response OmpR family regulator n=1 Tax=Labedaea rhizosphaerae TaxID=598644 RepID=A0A4R6RUK3_LABRH|nr:response regulator transcription factor [Labedaea rhizosphaerae]TDP90603.1 DNA-binding response OmpR family regulator [Labedaea rhizosphaerae]
MATILLVEDDSTIRAALDHALSTRGHTVQSHGTAFEALRDAAAAVHDIALLDLGLPDLDGESALRMLRSVSSMPVIVVTARGDDASVVRLLNAGADDYVVKPFSVDQIAARIGAVLRRAGHEEPDPALRVGELCLDRLPRKASFAGRELTLSRREFDLLAYLASRAGEVVTRRELMKEVWQQPHARDDQTIDVHVSGLRRKLGETAAKPRYLHTVRGVGLKLVNPS